MIGNFILFTPITFGTEKFNNHVCILSHYFPSKIKCFILGKHPYVTINCDKTRDTKFILPIRLRFKKSDLIESGEFKTPCVDYPDLTFSSLLGEIENFT